jgi:hypothetical protein
MRLDEAAWTRYDQGKGTEYNTIARFLEGILLEEDCLTTAAATTYISSYRLRRGSVQGNHQTPRRTQAEEAEVRLRPPSPCGEQVLLNSRTLGGVQYLVTLRARPARQGFTPAK